MGSKNFNFKVAGIRNLINFLNFLVILENHEIGLYVDILFSQNPILWIPVFPWFDNFFKPIWIKYAWSPDFSDSVMGLCCCCWVIRSYPTLWDPMKCSTPGSSVHEIYQARILEWVAISFSRRCDLWPWDKHSRSFIILATSMVQVSI